MQTPGLKYSKQNNGDKNATLALNVQAFIKFEDVSGDTYNDFAILPLVISASHDIELEE